MNTTVTWIDDPNVPDGMLPVRYWLPLMYTELPERVGWLPAGAVASKPLLLLSRHCVTLDPDVVIVEASLASSQSFRLVIDAGVHATAFAGCPATPPPNTAARSTRGMRTRAATRLFTP